MSNRQKILEAIANLGQPCGIDHLVAATSLTRKQVTDNLAGLKAEGKVHGSKDADGLPIYELVATPTTGKKRGRPKGTKATRPRKTPRLRPTERTALNPAAPWPFARVRPQSDRAWRKTALEAPV